MVSHDRGDRKDGAREIPSGAESPQCFFLTQFWHD